MGQSDTTDLLKGGRDLHREHVPRRPEDPPARCIRLAGYAGTSFDAVISGVDVTKYCRADKSLCSPGISLAPFLANHHCGFCVNTMHHRTQDVKFAGDGQVFRIIVLTVRRKVVVVYLESNFAGTTAAARRKFATARNFATFVPYAQKMLASISFS